MTRHIILGFFLVLFSFGISQNNYFPVKKNKNDSYALIENGFLNFIYTEEYLDSDNLLKYVVYDAQNQIVHSYINNPIIIKHGVNKLKINTASNNFNPNSTYTLEVINEKNEKWFLRFETTEVTNIITSDLELHYDFNNSSCYSGSGSVVNDLANKHDGTLTGSPNLVSKNIGNTTGLTGNCLEFDGTEGINLQNSFDLTDWTVSYWFHYRGPNTWQRFWGMSGYRMDIAERNGTFHFYDGGWVNTGISVPTADWHKITFAYQNSPRKLSLRINGAEVYSSARGRTMNTTAYINDSWDNHEAQCYLAEVLVYSKYLSEEEELINFHNNKADYGYEEIVTNNLSLHYDFSDPSCFSGVNTSVVDLSGQRNGTTTGSPQLTSKNIGSTQGLTGNCLEFNGTQGIDITNSFNHTDWTVSYWFHYRGNNNYYQRFWGMKWYRVEIAEVNGIFYVYDGGWINTGVDVPDQGWHKITFSYKNSPRTLSLRINGIELYNGTRGRTFNNTASITDSDDNREAQCYLGQVLVYSSYLTEEEETYNYYSQKEKYGR